VDVRVSTVVSSARGLTPVGHVGWIYRSRADFLARAVEYAVDGVRAGQWVQLVVPAADVEHIVVGVGPDPAGWGTCPPEEFFTMCGDHVEPCASAADLAAAAAEVVDSGYAGYRAVVDATALTATPDQQAAFARAEFLVDAVMSRMPFTALCAFDETELGPDTCAQLSCLHPHTQLAGGPSFRLFAQPPHAFALAGDIDLTAHDLLRRALRSITDCCTGLPTIDVDVRQLDFVDHRALMILGDWAETMGTRLRLHGANRLIATIAEILHLGAVELHEPC
jgi:hypothetical protein